MIYKKGTTMVEILIYLGLLSIFLVVLVNLFVTSVNFKLESESTSTLQSDSQFILAKLANDVGAATSLDVSGNTLILSTGTYSLSNGDLILTEGVQSAKLNSLDTTITNLTFTKLGNSGGGVPTVQIQFDIESEIEKQGNIKETRELQTTLGIR